MPDNHREDQKPIRPRYPEGVEPPAFRRFTGDQAPYPDQVYHPQTRPQAAASEKKTAKNTQRWAQGGTERRPRHTAVWVLAALVAFAALCLMGFYVASLYQAYPFFRQKAAILAADTFSQGIWVDHVHIGGMTRSEAERALNSQAQQTDASLWIRLHVDGQAWTVTPNDVPLRRNVSAVLDTAYAIGRQGSRETIGTNSTPFDYRYAHLYHTASTQVNLFTSVTYDPENVWSFLRKVEERVNKTALDAQVATFDFSSRTFTFTEDRQGAKLDTEDLYQKITNALDRHEYTATIAVSPLPVLPQITKVELMNTFTCVSTFKTQMTSNEKRNTNLILASRAINGTVLMPGETFSFNQATGQRTAEKGYQSAAAIAGGTTIEEVGGGVCQVSSTLFNAVALADLTIVERSPHAWPSSYVAAGRDATVNWPDLDFKFRNDKNTPVFLVVYCQNGECNVEIYGAALEAGTTISLLTNIVSVTDPPDMALYQNNPSLPHGTTQEKIKARTGYDVETYQVFRQNGKEIKRQLLCVSHYPMAQQVIEYN
ncbi:MAG: VanW family protein [Clostridia bacterium]|nr:VanW family protein [Clostridia bacterium]